jgi:hypothetical protein
MGHVARMGDMKSIHNFVRKSRRKRYHLANQLVDARLTLKRIKREEGVNWVYLAQYRVQRRGLVNMVINLHVP